VRVIADPVNAEAPMAMNVSHIVSRFEKARTLNQESEKVRKEYAATSL
jgi:hypothetical protein